MSLSLCWRRALAKEVPGGFLAQSAMVGKDLVDRLQGDDDAMQRVADRLRELSQESYFDDIFSALLQNMVVTLCDKSLPANAVLPGKPEW